MSFFGPNWQFNWVPHYGNLELSILIRRERVYQVDLLITYGILSCLQRGLRATLLTLVAVGALESGVTGGCFGNSWFLGGHS